VDDLEFPIPGERFGVGRESGGVPAVVSSELSGQLGRGVLGERAQPLRAVGAIPAWENSKVSMLRATGAMSMPLRSHRRAHWIAISCRAFTSQTTLKCKQKLTREFSHSY
jgi:hypothetical protein